MIWQYAATFIVVGFIIGAIGDKLHDPYEDWQSRALTAWGFAWMASVVIFLVAAVWRV